MKHYFALAVAGAAALGLFLAGSAQAVELDVTIGVGDNILVVNGQTSPNAQVTVLENNATIGNTTANASGNYSITFPAQTAGLRNLKVYARDSANRLTDTISRTINVTAHATTIMTVFLPPTIEINPSQVIEGESVRVQGETRPNSTVVVRVDNNINFETTSGSNGRWQMLIPTPGFFIGTHSLFAFTKAGGGLQSEPTAKRLFSVAAKPGQVTVTADTRASQRLSVPIITFPPDGFRTPDRQMTVRGTADGNIQIELWVDNNLVGAVFSNSRGEWQLDYFLRQRQHELKARACIGRRCSDFSDIVKVYYVGPLPDGNLTLRLSEYRFYRVLTGRPIRLDIFLRDGTHPYEIVVDWGDDKIQHLSHDTDRPITLQHAYQFEGLFNGSVTVKDEDGDIQIRHFSADVLPLGSQPFLILWEYMVALWSYVVTAAASVIRQLPIDIRYAILILSGRRRRLPPSDPPGHDYHPSAPPQP